MKSLEKQNIKQLLMFVVEDIGIESGKVRGTDIEVKPGDDNINLTVNYNYFVKKLIDIPKMQRLDINQYLKSAGKE